MCTAAKRAMWYGVITEEECLHVRDVCMGFIRELVFDAHVAALDHALHITGYADTFEQRLRIYRDWVNRWNMLERICVSTD